MLLIPFDHFVDHDQANAIAHMDMGARTALLVALENYRLQLLEEIGQGNLDPVKYAKLSGANVFISELQMVLNNKSSLQQIRS